MINRKHAIAALVLVGLLSGFLLGFLFHWRSAPPGVVEETTTEVQGGGNNPPAEAGNNGESAEKKPSVHLTFETSNALAHIVNLSSGIGYRPEGSAAESEAASYIASYFQSIGYETVHRQAFKLDNGAFSSNIFVIDPGAGNSPALVVGAHYDSAGGTGSPGANDNASGVGVVLELARVFRNNQNLPTIIFTAFGAEEILPGFSKDHHHYGSRYMAAHLHELGYNVVGMICVDMVGVGNTLTLNSTLRAPRTMVDLLTAYARRSGLAPVFRQDPGWSDHEAFENHGIPSVWIEYRDDPNYHSPSDTYDKINPNLVAQVGLLLQGFLESLNEADLQTLRHTTVYR